ncbi:MAG: AEC family transporter [Gammaproteobacteria bacterium]|nr:AEC family transporter [Gammaproteobacteria bacterium]
MSQVDLAYRIVTIIFPIFGIVAVGYLYARYRHNTDMSSGNRLNMEVFIPALIFDTLSASDYALSDYLLLTLGGAVVVLGSGLVAWPVARLLGYQWKTFVPPMMFSNSGNMGVPLIILTFGSAALPAAVLLFAIENFLHFLLGQQMITQRWSLKSVFQNPMILATLLGIGVAVLGIVVPDFLRLPIHMLGQVSIPLLLFSLGVRMISIDLNDWRIGSVAALVCPLSGLAIGIPFVQLLPLPGEQASILLLFGALPPAVLNFLVAERFNQEPQKVASIVLIANFASILVIPAVLWAIL